MPTAGDINLLRTKTRLSPEALVLADRLRVVSWVSIGITLVVGIVTGLLFLEFQRERDAVAVEKKQALSVIAANARKETLYNSLKDKIPQVTKALNSEKPWGQILDTVSTVALPPKLLSVSVDDRQVVLLSLKTTSFDDAAAWIASVIDLAGRKSIRSPQLVSLQLSKEGNILLSLSFIPQ